VNLSFCSVIINYVCSSLPQCIITRQESLILNIITSCKEVDLGSDISEVMNDVDILVSCFPMMRQINLHSSEVETPLPMDLVLVTSHNWDSPGKTRTSLNPKGYVSIIAGVRIIGSESGVVHLSDYTIINLKNFHCHNCEDVWCVVVEHDPSDLHR
jgi:hypothetical protein